MSAFPTDCYMSRHVLSIKLNRIKYDKYDTIKLHNSSPHVYIIQLLAFNAVDKQRGPQLAM